MNTSMADSARERCGAQIDEALLCRPGMTLDEIATRCMAERSRSGFEPILHDSIFDACGAELNRLRTEMDQVAGCLPGVYYMGPPDGGNVSIPEQVRRMAEDAAHHRNAATPAQAVGLADFKALYRAYVRLLESARDRINDLGGSCHPVDLMEANDVDLQAARRVINSRAVQP